MLTHRRFLYFAIYFNVFVLIFNNYVLYLSDNLICLITELLCPTKRIICFGHIFTWIRKNEVFQIFLDLYYKKTLSIFHCSTATYCKCMNQLFMVASSQTFKRCNEGMKPRQESVDRALLYTHPKCLPNLIYFAC